MMPLTFDIVARDMTAAGFAGLNRSINAVEQRFGLASMRIGSSFAGIGLAAAAVATPFAMAIGNSIKQMDRFALASQQIGMPVEELSRLSWAAQQSGVEFEALTASMGRLARAMSESVETATSQQARAFAALRVSVTDSNGALRSSGDVLADVAARISVMEDGARKTALVMEIFGKSGAALIPLLNEGKDGIRRFADEADRLGLTVSGKSAKAADEFGDTLDRLKGSVGGVSNSLAAGLLPSLQQAADWFETGGAAAVAFGSKVSSVFEKINAKALEWRTNLGIEAFFDRASLFGSGTEPTAGTSSKQTITATMGRPGRRVAFDAGLQGRFGAGPLSELSAALTEQAEQLGKDAAKAMDKGLVAGDPWAGLRQVTTDSFAEIAQTARTELSPVGEIVADHFSTAFDSLIDGTFNARDALADLARDIARMFANRAIMQFVSAFFPGAGAGLSPFNAARQAAGFGGLFADGGRLEAGEWGIAGEAGPEIIHGPATITPVDKAAAMPNIQIINHVPPGHQVEQRRRRGGGGEIIIEQFVKSVGSAYGLKKPATQT